MISSLPIYLKMQMINKPKKYEGRADAGEPVGERIHKLLAQSGYGSRREIEKAILEDLLAAAVNDAVRRVETQNREKMAEVTAGMNLPAGMKMPF